MIFSAAFLVSVLALVPSSLGLVFDARNNGCTFVCPGNDAYGYGLTTSNVNDGKISCSYSGGSGNLCTYDVSTGALVGNKDGCPAQAVQQCSPRRSRQLKQAIVRRGGYDGHPNEWKPAPSPNGGWKRHGPPGPSHTWDKRGDSWPDVKPTPAPSPTPPGKPGPQPPKEQPCNYTCPQNDLAKSPLTDEAIRDSALYCSYSAQDCKTCSFCKYSTKTGLLLEDNDDGNCPQTATLSRPWDLRYI